MRFGTEGALSPLIKSLMKVFNRSSPSTEPWGAALVSGSQMANPAVCVQSWLGPCLKTKLAGPKQRGGRRAMAWELSSCLSARQALVLLLHPCMGTAPVGVSSGQGNSPPSIRACCPSPQQFMVLGSTGSCVKHPLHPAAQRTAGREEGWGWWWQQRDTAICGAPSCPRGRYEELGAVTGPK